MSVLLFTVTQSEVTVGYIQGVNGLAQMLGEACGTRARNCETALCNRPIPGIAARSLRRLLLPAVQWRSRQASWPTADAAIPRSAWRHSWESSPAQRSSSP